MGAPARALIVDDDALFRGTVAGLLRQRSWTVVEAASGAEADAELERGDFGLFVVEGALPDIDGVRWLERLAERSGSEGSKRAFASTLRRDGETVRRLTRELGVGLVLFKPVEASALASQLDALVAPRKTAAAPDSRMGKAREAMADLRTEYQRELPGKVADLARAVRRVRLQLPTSADSEVFDEARSKAHRLCGTAGSYGFASVGEAAGRIEDALPLLLDLRSPRRGQAWTEIEQALHELWHAACIDPLAMP